jgi:hypothetical protein
MSKYVLAIQFKPWLTSSSASHLAAGAYAANGVRTDILFSFQSRIDACLLVVYMCIAHPHHCDETGLARVPVAPSLPPGAVGSASAPLAVLLESTRRCAKTSRNEGKTNGKAHARATSERSRERETFSSFCQASTLRLLAYPPLPIFLSLGLP